MLTADASSSVVVAVAAIRTQPDDSGEGLTQPDDSGEGRQHPVAYESTAAERNHPARVLGRLAAVRALRVFKHFLLGLMHYLLG